MYCGANIPPQFLEREIAPHTELAIWHVLVSPRLEMRVVGGRGAGGGLAGSCGSSSRTPAGCRRASPRRRSSARPCGRSRPRSRCRRAGRSSAARRRSSWASSTGACTGDRCSGGRSNDATSDRAKAEWVVEATAGSSVEIEARAGQPTPGSEPAAERNAGAARLAPAAGSRCRAADCRAAVRSESSLASSRRVHGAAALVGGTMRRATGEGGVGRGGRRRARRCRSRLATSAPASFGASSLCE